MLPLLWNFLNSSRDVVSKFVFSRTSPGDYCSKDFNVSLVNWALTPNLVNFGHVRLVCLETCPQVFKHMVHPFVFSPCGYVLHL